MKAVLVFTVLAAALPAWSTPGDPAAAGAADAIVPPTHAQLVARALQTSEAVWQSALDPAKYDPRSSDLLLYALALCEGGQHPERLETLIDLAARMQVRNPDNPSYGSFRWAWNDKAVKDGNTIEFAMQSAALLWLRHRATLPTAARERLHAMIDPAAVAASLRHRVSDGSRIVRLASACGPRRNEPVETAAPRAANVGRDSLRCIRGKSGPIHTVPLPRRRDGMVAESEREPAACPGIPSISRTEMPEGRLQHVEMSNWAMHSSLSHVTASVLI